MDLLDPGPPDGSGGRRRGSDPFSMDVLINAFRTEVGDPLKKGGVRYCADLTSLGGSIVRVRFAQVDNQMRAEEAWGQGRHKLQDLT